MLRYSPGPTRVPTQVGTAIFSGRHRGRTGVSYNPNSRFAETMYLYGSEGAGKPMPGMVEGPNAGRNLPSAMDNAGAGYRPGAVNIPDLPQAPPVLQYGGTGFPVGSVNLKPSKFSGGFSTQMKLNIQNQRTGSMRDIDRRKAASGAVGGGPGAPMFAPQAKGFAPAPGGMGGPMGPGGVNIPDLPGAGNGGGMIDPNSDLGQYLASVDAGQAAARQANEQRYADILAAYNAREKHAFDGLTGLGASERQAIDDRHKQAASRSAQDLAARGLGNSTVRASVMKGHADAASRQQTALQEDLMRERLNMLNNLQSEKLAFMERRNDVGPDLGAVSNLAMAFGGSGASPLMMPGAQPAARPGVGGPGTAQRMIPTYRPGARGGFRPRR
jgi:hypothetical protein